MNKRSILLIAIFVSTLALGLYLFKKFRKQEVVGPFTQIAMKLNSSPQGEWCDRHVAQRRKLLAGVVDLYREEIHRLLLEREAKDAPSFALLRLGEATLRISPMVPPQTGYDTSIWSWEESYGLLLRTQSDPKSEQNKTQWRDLFAIVRYLLEHDLARVIHKTKFLPPANAPRIFQPGKSVKRVGAKAFEIQLDPGEFEGHEAKLEKVIEDEWNSEGYSVRVRWAKSSEAAPLFRFRLLKSSERSFVNRRSKTIEIANLAWTKTVAHEVGHILGFADHYFSVWNEKGCYYTQESRLSDIMSDSQRGRVTRRHWQILDQAYPWQAPAKEGPFQYVWGE